MKRYIKASTETPSETAHRLVRDKLDFMRDLWYEEYYFEFEDGTLDEKDHDAIDREIHNLIDRIYP